MRPAESTPANRRGRRLGPRRRLGVALVFVLLLASAALLALAVLRGRLAVPAGRLERALSEALGATVRVGALRLEEGPRRAVLRDLVVTEMASAPQLRRLEIARLVLYGGARDLLGGDFERGVVEGARAVVEPRCGPPPSLPASAADRARGRRYEVSILPATVLVRGPGPERTLRLEGTVASDGAGLRGDLVLRAEEVELRSLLALWRAEALLSCTQELSEAPTRNPLSPAPGLDGTVLDASAAVHFEPAPAPSRFRADVRAEAHALRLHGPELPTSLELTAPAASGEVLLGASPAASFAVVLPDTSPIEVAWSFREGDLHEAQVVANGIDLGAWSERLAAAGMPAPLRVEGTADLELDLLENGGSASFSARLQRLAYGDGPELRAAGARLELRDLDRAAGTARLSGELEARQIAGAEPALAGAAAPVRVRVEGSLVGFRLPRDGEPLAITAEGALRADSEALGTLTATGEVSLAQRSVGGRYEWRHEDGGALWRELRAVFAARSSATGPSRRDLDAWQVDGAIRAGGTFTAELASGNVRSSGRVAVSQGVLASAQDGGAEKSWRWSPGELTLDYELSRGAVRFAVGAEGPLALTSLATVSVAVEGNGSWREGALSLERVALQSPGLGLVELDGELDAAGAGAGTSRLRGGEVRAWREWLEPLLAGSAPPATELRGEMEGDARWERARERWSVEGEVALHDGGWSVADGSRAVAAFAPRLRVATRARGDGLELDAAGEIGGFQLLWGPVFADFTDRAVAVEVALVSPPSARLEPSSAPALAERPWQASVHITGDGGASLQALAQRSTGDAWTWQAEGRVGDLATVVERYVTSPFALEGTPWHGLAASGGVTFEGRGALRADGGALEAELLWTEGSARLGDRVAAAGLHAHLPVALRWRRTQPGSALSFDADGAPRAGRLAFGSLRFGDFELGATALPLEVAGDDVVLEGPLRVPMFEGELLVSGLHVADALSAERHLEADLALREISLERVAEAFDLPVLRGRVDASFPRVTLRGDELVTEGQSEVRVFGGRVVLEDVAAAALGSPFPHLSFSAAFEDIDLEQLTQTLEFGRITGVLRGSLREVELVGTTPSRLLGEVRTVERPGIPQRLSIKAVNNLTLLGTGADASFLERGVRSLFETYPYEAIGIAVLLEGDDFVLRGLERRGDKELFLKGRWPLRLDIVNAMPGTRVSYEVMTSRIGNLEIRRGKQEPVSEGEPP